MKKLIFFFMVLVLVSMTISISSAATYTYDFSSLGYTPDQDLEGMVKDLATFTSEAGGTGLRYLVWESYYAGIGGSRLGPGQTATADIYITFSAPVDQVSFRAGDGLWDYDAYAVSVYEFGTDSFLGMWTTPLFGGPDNEPEFYTLTINFANIGRIVFDPGNSGELPGELNNGGGVVIEDMSYATSSVPEPVTMLLLGLGLACLVATKKKFRK